MALECIKGTTVPIVDVVREAKSEYISKFEGREGPFGMCQSLLITLRNQFGAVDHIFCTGLSNYIPLFCKTVAKARFGADVNKAYWWPDKNYSVRLAYFDWLIEQYSKEV